MLRHQVVDGADGFRTWTVAANILNKRSRTADKGCFQAWVLDGANNALPIPRLADGGDDLQVLEVAANILNKQSWKTDKGWLSSLGVGWD
jgi:hypothetical protein